MCLYALTWWNRQHGDKVALCLHCITSDHHRVGDLKGHLGDRVGQIIEKKDKERVATPAQGFARGTVSQGEPEVAAVVVTTFKTPQTSLPAVFVMWNGAGQDETCNLEVMRFFSQCFGHFMAKLTMASRLIDNDFNLENVIWYKVLFYLNFTCWLGSLCQNKSATYTPPKATD